MKVIVTCGPSFEPIDEVRRITNFATGEIGTLLSNALAAAGHEVICFRGSGSNFPAPLSAAVRVETFTTNQSLLDALRAESKGTSVGAVFHAAALSDFSVSSVETESFGEKQSAGDVGRGKISSSEKSVLLRLKPAPKLLSFFREFFPQAFLVAWKYEVEGGEATAEKSAREQLRRYDTDACVLNGPAVGVAFRLFLKERKTIREFADKAELVAALTGETKEQNVRFD